MTTRRRIELQGRTTLFDAQRLQVRQGGTLRVADILQKSARSADRKRQLIDAEAA